MIRKKDKNENIDEEPFNHIESWGFEDIFKEFSQEFQMLNNTLNKLFEEAAQTDMLRDKGFRPYFYGWNFYVGPDGKSRFSEFGNNSLKHAENEEIREPYVDIHDNNMTVSITAEIPGVSEKDIDLEITNDTVIIKVDKGTRKYYKKIALQSNVNTQSSKITYQNGILDIELQKMETKNKEK